MLKGSSNSWLNLILKLSAIYFYFLAVQILDYFGLFFPTLTYWVSFFIYLIESVEDMLLYLYKVLFFKKTEEMTTWLKIWWKYVMLNVHIIMSATIDHVFDLFFSFLFDHCLNFKTFMHIHFLFPPQTSYTILVYLFFLCVRFF